MTKATPAAFWLRRARICSTAINAAALWQRMVSPFVVLNLVFAAYLLVCRRSGNIAAGGLIGYFALLAALAVWAFFRTRGKRYTIEDALLRIETAQGLKNRLSCAYAGVTEWPPKEVYCGKTIKLRLHIALLPVFYSLLFIFAGLWWPIRTGNVTFRADTFAEPSAWTQVAGWAELLKEERLIAEQAARKLDERLAQLRERSKDEWYKQGSLEAGEALRDETRLAMQELARQLQAASALMEQMPLQQAALGMNGVAAEKLDEMWHKQLQSLQNGELSIDPQLMGNLQPLSFSQMNNLTPDQFQAMQDQLRQGAQRVGGAAGLSDLDLQAVNLQIAQAGFGAAERGPGPAPLVLANNGTDLQTTTRQGVSNQDVRHAVLGETVGVSSRPGNDDQQTPFTSGVQASGGDNSGSGGKITWQETYTPQERAILEQYFK